MPKQKKRSMRGLVLMLVVFAVGVYLAIYFIEGQMHIATLEQELGMVESELADLQFTNEDLTDMVQAENQDDYVQRVAREEMDYVYPNDRVFVDISGN